ncbi:MAG: flavin reductase family protein [Asticcacaulis sp.]
MAKKPKVPPSPFHTYEPQSGHGLNGDPFNAIIGPRPIGWFSTVSKSGIPNLAPYSFFNGFNYYPPIIGFSSLSLKDTARNCAETGEFVWNMATEPLAQAMNASSAQVSEAIDEFMLAGLQALPSKIVKPPRVAQSPVSFECKVTQQFQLTNLRGETTPAWMTFGEVVCVHIHKDYIRDGVFDTAAAQPILRSGGQGDYFRVTEETKFVMPRPK